MFNMTLNEFLETTGITKDEWKKSNTDWTTLEKIALDFEKNKQALSSAAEHISSEIRTFNSVHSVRWRIKNTLHILKKIVRKKLEEKPKEKWITINSDNYLDVITDLIGVRALHLFKDECISIDESIREAWNLREQAVIYIRDGDTVPQNMTDRGSRAEIHEAGYRSIHYIIESQPGKKRLSAEIQVRTIFQEGWSEIDHKVRYPDFSDNEHIGVFLDLFNGLAGSADEMGSFVKDLVRVLKVGEEEKNAAIQERQLAIQERDQAIADMTTKLNELDKLKKQDKESAAIISKLKGDLQKIRHSQSVFESDEFNMTFGRTISSGMNPPPPSSRITSTIGSTVLTSTLGKAFQGLQGVAGLQISPTTTNSHELDVDDKKK